MPEDEIVIFETEDKSITLPVSVRKDTVWLSANQMAELFERDEKTIRKHINNVFSEGEVERENNTQKMRVEECKNIDSMKYMDKSSMFGNEKDESFKGSIGTIYQSFDGEDVYLTLEEKAANLLYFITKNHSFSDGNKRIAATMFLYFLDKNGVLFRVGAN